MHEPLLYRIPAWLIAGGLFVSMALLWEIYFRIGAKKATAAKAKDLGPIDAGVAGLLALILAFSFSMASERFDAREQVIVDEAIAIDTTYLRCEFLVPSEQAPCRQGLARYAKLRVAFFEAGADLEKFRAVVAQTERLHEELWQTVKRSQAERDTPALALAVSSMNETLDLHVKRVAARRRIVPQEVTVVTLLLCLAWGGFAGYICGLSGNSQRVSWLGFALLASLVILVSVDLDRPGRGFIRPVRGHSIMVDLAAKLNAQRVLPP